MGGMIKEIVICPLGGSNGLDTNFQAEHVGLLIYSISALSKETDALRLVNTLRL